MVSLWHAKLTSIRGKAYFSDLGSSNGSYLNGKIVAPDLPIEIASGDRILLGETELEVQLVKAAPPAEAVGAGAGAAGAKA